MKHILSITAALALTAGAAFAQTTSQHSVIGQSGDADFPLQVQGRNGVTYNCRNEVVVVEGVRARQCIRADGSGLLGAGVGMSAGTAFGIGALVLVAAAGNGNSSTTTTNP